MKYFVFLLMFCWGCSKTSDVVLEKKTTTSYAQEGTFQLATPIISSSNVFFEKENIVTLTLNHEDTRIFYTLDGSEPTEASKRYLEPIKVAESLELKAKAFHNNYLPSELVAQQFFKIKGEKSVKAIQYLTAPSPNYTANGGESLFDQKKGSTNFRDNHWLGFQNDTIEFIVELVPNVDLKKIILSQYANSGAWIFKPAEVIVFGSMDGEHFKKIGETQLLEMTQESASGFYFVEIETPESDGFSFVKILLKNIPSIPDWHAGKGTPAWIFLDEILIE